MKSTTLSVLLIAFLCPASLFAQRRASHSSRAARSSRPGAVAEPGIETLPIRRVILYSNGVAYIERRGKVTGHAEISLQFKQSQVDDVLKSMVVLDMGHGRVGAVSYNSSAPPSARLNDIPFSIEAGTDNTDGGGLAGVLKQLQGARVVVTTANRTATGSILTVEASKSQIDANKPPVTTHTLVIASDSGEIVSLNLGEVRAIKLADEGSRRDITQFADASASARRRDAKTIVVTSDGEGAREMMVSYTVAAPIWKTSYRVVLDSTGQPFFQGWAIVDNVSDEDWNDVSLSMVSGTPISFVQPLQKPLYRYRPVVPIPEDLKLDPQVYEADEGGGSGAGLAGAPSKLSDSVPSITPDMAQRSSTITAQQIQNLPSTNRNDPNGYIGSLAVGRRAPRTTPSVSNTITSGDSGVEAAASGEEVGDLFEYRIDQPITVRHDRSALIPILQTRMEGVSVYNESVRKDRPMGGMRLKNTSPLTLEDGAITVIDSDAYAGEALLQRLKPGETRFVSFALDLGTLVTARLKRGREPVFMVRAVGGILEIHYHQTEEKVYTLTNQTDHPRIVYVEHPIRGNWELTKESREPSSKTPSFYRFKVEIAPRQKVELSVEERQASYENFTVMNLTSHDIELLVTSRYIDGRLRAALDHIVEIKGRLSAIEARLTATDAEMNEISQDQGRLRENIKALKDTTEARQLLARYVSKADGQETRIEQLTTDRKNAVAERSRIQAELEGAVRALSVDRM
jgi:hypothetical protein